MRDLFMIRDSDSKLRVAWLGITLTSDFRLDFGLGPKQFRPNLD